MISPEKEIVPFSKMIDVNDGEKKRKCRKMAFRNRICNERYIKINCKKVIDRRN